MRSVVRLVDGSVGVARTLPDIARIEFSPGDPRRPDFAELIERGDAPRVFTKMSDIDEVLEVCAVELIEPEPFDAKPVTPGPKQPAWRVDRRIDDIVRLPVVTGV